MSFTRQCRDMKSYFDVLMGSPDILTLNISAGQLIILGDNWQQCLQFQCHTWYQQSRWSLGQINVRIICLIPLNIWRHYACQFTWAHIFATSQSFMSPSLIRPVNNSMISNGEERNHHQQLLLSIYFEVMLATGSFHGISWGDKILTPKIWF